MTAAFDPVAFLERAVRRPSHEDVAAMRSLLVETLEAHGVDARIDDAGNTIATKEAAADGPHVVLNTHIDTVSPHVPFERDGDVIRGRGSCDAKGPLAALLAAFLAVDPERGRLTLAITPDEETLSLGAAALDLDGDCYVVGEPTGLDVCVAAKGRFQGTLTLTGVNAHAAEAHTGVNAVAAAEQALAAVATFDEGREPHPQLGESSLTPTVVRGGEATNQVPAECAIVLDRRSVPPETAQEFREALGGHVRAAVPDEIGVSFALTDRESPFLAAFATDPDEPLVGALAEAAAAATDGDAGVVRPFTAATEASYFAPAPTVVFGPGYLADETGAVAHADREYVPVAQVEAAAHAVTEAVRTCFDE
ncbi:M20/M25/M40 family metallo-hydrolase [Haloferacaceae archaeon DSL9]